MDPRNQSEVKIVLSKEDQRTMFFDRVPAIGESVYISGDELASVDEVAWGLDGKATILAVVRGVRLGSKAHSRLGYFNPKTKAEERGN